MQTSKIQNTVTKLLQLDFMLLKQNDVSNYSNKFIEADYLIVSLKQFSHVISSLFTAKQNSKILLVVGDITEKFFVEHCLAKLELAKYVSVFTHLRDIKPDTDNNPKALVLLNRASFTTFKALSRKMSCLKTLMVFNISLKTPGGNGDGGIYSVYNQVNSMNKTLFMLLLMKKAIHTKIEPIVLKTEEEEEEKVVCEE